MKDPENPFPSSFGRKQNEQASRWLARHERGLSEEETRAFEQWLAEDPGNEACFFEHQVAWAAFDVMDEWKPAYGGTPNPDLFEARPKSRWSGFFPYAGLAAAVLLGFFLFLASRQKVALNETLVGTTYESRQNEKHFLEDGSSFYLRPDSKVVVTFSEEERKIEFVSGEAHFSVAHDPLRPFVVYSKLGRVTAVGTVFSVRQDSNSWEVFVTEGKVKVDEEESSESPIPETETFSAELIAGQKIVQELSAEVFSPKIASITASELEKKLAWKDQIIDMVSAPLEEILIEFSRYNKRDVIIVDEDLRRMRMSVAIKPDNLEDFIDLLELSAGIKATDTPSGSILLSRSSN